MRNGTNAKPVCDAYSLLVIVSARCLCRPLTSFNDIDAALPLTNQCSSIRPSLVGSLPIFGRIGASKSTRNTLNLLVAPVMTFSTLVEINVGFVPWEKSFNLFKIYM